MYYKQFIKDTEVSQLVTQSLTREFVLIGSAVETQEISTIIIQLVIYILHHILCIMFCFTNNRKL